MTEVPPEALAPDEPDDAPDPEEYEPEGDVLRSPPTPAPSTRGGRGRGHAARRRALGRGRVSDRFVVVPAAYVFLLRDGTGGPEVLLQLRQNTGYMDDHWAAAAAGHVEQGETAYDAAHREAAEEIGVSDVALEFVTSMQRTRQRAADRRADRLLLHRPVVDRRADRSSSPTSAPTCAGARSTICRIRWCPHELRVLDALRMGTTVPYMTFGFPEGGTDVDG